MNTEGFTKMNKEAQDQTYGGWAWLIALVPMLIQSIVTTVAAIKTLTTDGKGSIKTSSTGSVEAHWDDGPDSKTASKRTAATKGPTNTVYYAY